MEYTDEVIFAATSLAEAGETYFILEDEDVPQQIILDIAMQARANHILIDIHRTDEGANVLHLVQVPWWKRTRRVLTGRWDQMRLHR